MQRHAVELERETSDLRDQLLRQAQQSSPLAVKVFAPPGSDSPPHGSQPPPHSQQLPALATHLLPTVSELKDQQTRFAARPVFSRPPSDARVIDAAHGRSVPNAELHASGAAHMQLLAVPADARTKESQPTLSRMASLESPPGGRQRRYRGRIHARASHCFPSLPCFDAVLFISYIVFVDFFLSSAGAFSYLFYGFFLICSMVFSSVFFV